MIHDIGSQFLETRTWVTDCSLFTDEIKIKAVFRSLPIEVDPRTLWKASIKDIWSVETILSLSHSLYHARTLKA